MSSRFGQGSRLPALVVAAGALTLTVIGPFSGLPAWLAVIFGLTVLTAGGIALRAPSFAERASRATLSRPLGLDASVTLEQAAAQAVETVRDLRDELARQAAQPWHDRPEAAILLEALSEATMLIGSDGVVRLANDRCRRLLGLDQSPAGRHVEELITKAELLEEVASARRGIGGRSKIRLPRPEGALICETTTTPIGTGEPIADVLVSIRDITELAGAMQLKTDFVANASHELRTPISAIRAAADTLEAAGGDEAMRERLVVMIQNHVTQLDQLVRDLLDLSKLESAEAPIAIKPFALSDLAADLATMFAEACDRRGITLEFELDPSLEHMLSDRRLLMLIAKNLVENATKYARENTAIRVIAEPTPADDPNAGGLRGLLLRVIDRGQGIPLSQQNRIFERFYQVDSARTGIGPRGTGLGLAIVKHSAKLLEGTVEVESVWGQGTTMIVRLPACVASTPS